MDSQNSKELLANLKTQNFSQIKSIKTYDFSTIYTTIPHDKLKSRLLDIMGKGNNIQGLLVIQWANI
jgi:hypothetical protein